MRSALKLFPALVIVATAASAIGSAVSCGPPELFLGAFDSVDGSTDAPEDRPPRDRTDASMLGEPDATCRFGLEDAGATVIGPLRDPACHACATSNCCSTVAACFDDPSDAGAQCALYASCIDQCRVAFVDATVPHDASGSDCESVCSSLGPSTRYSALVTCLAETCACPSF